MIQPLDVPTPAEFGDDLYVKYEVLLQIETWSKSRSLTKNTADRIESILWDLGLLQTGGIDEFDAEIFRMPGDTEADFIGMRLYKPKKPFFIPKNESISFYFCQYSAEDA